MKNYSAFCTKKIRSIKWSIKQQDKFSVHTFYIFIAGLTRRNPLTHSHQHGDENEVLRQTSSDAECSGMFYAQAKHFSILIRMGETFHIK